ncbi:2-haloacid dehalogenase [Geosmithia morbida]|uniref:2-haloacid dehalogenase n=1 Tax=Geosmithia morbida TaxID=1094350 RepID=A0A9P4YVX3_9HYPO|nr:2-haloacid dehalogenase [Geosmithia morbida]KAF4123825.1 2-haloacid dehalogenase [Geosmithia morbida]
MAEQANHVVFDVVGTCVSFDAYYETIENVMGGKLRQHGMTAKHFGFTWQTAAELEFTFLSVAGSYLAYKDVMRGLFYRSLWMAGVANPRAVATDDEREACIQGYSSLKLRSDCDASFQKLRDNGFTVWCFTTGDIQRVRGYFDRASVSLPVANIISSDSVGVAKPALAAYEHVWARLGRDGAKWFAAAHMWDVSAATKVGFRGAWCSALEKEPCLDVFQNAEMEVMADSLLELADGIIKISQKNLTG